MKFIIFCYSKLDQLCSCRILIGNSNDFQPLHGIIRDTNFVLPKFIGIPKVKISLANLIFYKLSWIMNLCRTYDSRRKVYLILTCGALAKRAVDLWAWLSENMDRFISVGYNMCNGRKKYVPRGQGSRNERRERRIKKPLLLNAGVYFQAITLKSVSVCKKQDSRSLAPDLPLSFYFCKRCQKAALNQAISGPTLPLFFPYQIAYIFYSAWNCVGLSRAGIFLFNVPCCWSCAAAASPWRISPVTLT